MLFHHDDKALELLVRLMSDEGLDLSSLDPGGTHRLWYQSRTVCRKTLLLVDVESSVCENYLTKKILTKIWVGFFLLLIWHRSNSESPYLELIWKVLLSFLVLQNLGAFWAGHLTIWPRVELSRVSCVFFAPSFSWFSWENSFHNDLSTLWIHLILFYASRLPFALYASFFFVCPLSNPYLVLEATLWLLSSGIIWAT
jgi:hypothetical protein